MASNLTDTAAVDPKVIWCECDIVSCSGFERCLTKDKVKCISMLFLLISYVCSDVY